jgi:ABC-type uncharacterized transport system fused permease/ATPase subunit
VLEDVGLGALASELNMVENWSQRLSLGEQQRLAFARILLVEPAILFLDEATSALDEPSETQLYGLLRTASWRPTVVSVGHRSTLRIFHKFVLDVAAFNPRCEQLLTGSKSDLDVVTPAFPGARRVLDRKRLRRPRAGCQRRRRCNSASRE